MEATNKLTPWERELIEEAFRRQHNQLISLAERAQTLGIPDSMRSTVEAFDSAVAKVRRLIGDA